MFRKFAALIILVLMLPASGQAQSGLTFSAVKVDLWPEFDRPEMLVIYHLTLSAQSVPADINLHIPAAAGQVHAVAAQQPDGRLINLTFEQRPPSGEWSEVVFKATSPEVQIEYYDPSLVKQDAIRKFTYRWAGDYAVDAFLLEVQQPIDASDMDIPSGTGSGVTRNDGLVYYTKEIGALPAGQTLEVALSYQKPTDTLSANVLQIQPSSPIDETTAGRATTLTTALPWLLGGLGLLLIVGGGWWYWQSGRTKARPERRARHKPAAQRNAAPVAAENQVYCHQCGKRAVPGDRFCRTCGTQLRTGSAGK